MQKTKPTDELHVTKKDAERVEHDLKKSKEAAIACEDKIKDDQMTAVTALTATKLLKQKL